MALLALAICAVLAMVGINRLKGAAFVPNRTLEQMREDIVVAKEHVR